MLLAASPTAIALRVDVHTCALSLATSEGLYAPATPEAMFATEPPPNATVSALTVFAPLPIAAESYASSAVTPPNAARELEAFAIVF